MAKQPHTEFLTLPTPAKYRKIAHEPAAIEALFVDLLLEAHDRPPQQIILDLDATDDPLHGHQEGRLSDAKCNTPRRFDIGKVVQDLKECCHAILFASVGGRKRPDRRFAGRGAVDGGHCPSARSGESHQAVEQQRVEYSGIFGKEAADALIDQEYYCSFEAAILRAYWGKELLRAEQQRRICDVPVNWDLPVHTAWDIGVVDAMAIFKSTPTTSTSWTTTRATAWAPATIATGSTLEAITAPTGCPTTRRFAMLERQALARGLRRSSRWAASPSLPPSRR